jgi:hypothetical protein
MRERLELPRAFKVGMVFALNADLFGPKWQVGETGAVFVDTVAITATEVHSLSGFSLSSKPERTHCTNYRGICRRLAQKSSLCREDEEN